MKKKFWWILLVILVLIQFIPYGIENEARDEKADFFVLEKVDGSMEQMIRTACYDCHSQESQKPWYSYVAPVKFWVNLHVRGGRQNLDFSKWGTLDEKKKSHKLEEAAEMVGKGAMPLKSYTLGHPEAKLSDDQRAALEKFFLNLR